MSGPLKDGELSIQEALALLSWTAHRVYAHVAVLQARQRGESLDYDGGLGWKADATALKEAWQRAQLCETRTQITKPDGRHALRRSDLLGFALRKALGSLLRRQRDSPADAATKKKEHAELMRSLRVTLSEKSWSALDKAARRERGADGPDLVAAQVAADVTGRSKRVQEGVHKELEALLGQGPLALESMLIRDLRDTNGSGPIPESEGMLLLLVAAVGMTPEVARRILATEASPVVRSPAVPELRFVEVMAIHKSLASSVKAILDGLENLSPADFQEAIDACREVARSPELPLDMHEHLASHPLPSVEELQGEVKRLREQLLARETRRKAVQMPTGGRHRRGP